MGPLENQEKKILLALLKIFHSRDSSEIVKKELLQKIDAITNTEEKSNGITILCIFCNTNAQGM